MNQEQLEKEIKILGVQAYKLLQQQAVLQLKLIMMNRN